MSNSQFSKEEIDGYKGANAFFNAALELHQLKNESSSSGNSEKAAIYEVAEKLCQKFVTTTSQI